MPTYDYHCDACDSSFEIEQKITADPLKECPKCHSFDLRRGPGGGIGLAFKGTGFYITDYARAEEKPACKEEGKQSSCCPCSDSNQG